MRMRALLGVLGGLLLLFVLLGCENDESTGLRTTVTGTVTGLPAVGESTIALVKNGQIVRSTVVSGPNANLNFMNIPAGTYFVVVTQPDGTVRTIAGPVVVTEADRTVNIQVPAFTATTLPTGVTVPTNGTATLAVVATDANGNPVNATVTVDALAPVTGSPAIVTDIPAPGPHTVTVVANGQTLNLGSFAFDANKVTVVRIGEQIAPPAQEFNIAGTVRNAATDAVVPNATVRVIGVTGASDATDANGAYAINAIPANTAATAYTLSVTDGLLATYAGPVTGTTGTVNLPDILTGTTADLANLGTGVTVPTNGTATVIISAIERSDSTSTQVGVTSATIGAQTFNDGLPLIATGVTTTGTAVGIQVVTADGTVTVPNVTLQPNAVTVVTAFIPAPAP